MRRKRKDWLVFGSGKSYLDRVHHPLQCLIFITPLLLFYQIGSSIDRWPPEQATLYCTSDGMPVRNTAWSNERSHQFPS